jgi:hypothetical protein
MTATGSALGKDLLERVSSQNLRPRPALFVRPVHQPDLSLSDLDAGDVATRKGAAARVEVARLDPLALFSTFLLPLLETLELFGEVVGLLPQALVVRISLELAL